ncbi:MAG: arginine--tRNA ligase [Acidobacteriota bacterium]
MLKELKADLAAALADRIRDRFDVDHDPVVQVPPRRALGDLAFPAPLHLARVLKRKPRDIATELADGWTPAGPVRAVRVEGAGYLNVFLDRPAIAAALLRAPALPAADPTPSLAKVVVEHTNINPNKAAHIGHLRNAVLGDILVRALRRLGHAVEIQNYIDDTGVQVADVVVGFLDLRGNTIDDIAAIPEPFDVHCWDLYSAVGRWYQDDPSRDALRRQTLHAMEHGALGEALDADAARRAAAGRLVAQRIVRCHLATMARLGIGYDVLTHESDILGLRFFADAFEGLKASGAVRLEEDGKNAGCWVMPLSQSEEFAGLEDPDKVIVRSDGTVTYVGKDIAYQLWKFGLLGRDFRYRFWQPDATDDRTSTETGIWVTTTDSAGAQDDHPAFGAAAKVVNVIDARQSYLQKIVRAGLEAMGHSDEAARSVHFAYEMVSLSRKTAVQLGFLDEKAEGDGKTLEMSGRKGIGVKADDLLDQLEAHSRTQIAQRDPEADDAAVAALARDIATAALRFFMVKATTTRVIAFDLDAALSFEGETGPYLQYSLVREANIRRKAEAAGERVAIDVDSLLAVGDAAADADGPWPDDLWDLVLFAAQSPEVVAKAADTLELSLIARHALDLAQRFHGCYHHHRILGETDQARRQARLAANRIFRDVLSALMDLMGMPIPERM